MPASFGKYNEAIEAAADLRWVHTSRPLGLLADKKLPRDTAWHAHLAWEHMLRITGNVLGGVSYWLTLTMSSTPYLLLVLLASQAVTPDFDVT